MALKYMSLKATRIHKHFFLIPQCCCKIAVLMIQLTGLEGVCFRVDVQALFCCPKRPF